MTTTLLALPQPGSPAPARRRRILLVDASSDTRELRAETMRKLGMDVDCACDISEARSWWRADLYNLVLVNTEAELGHRDQFCEDVRNATPPQRLAFLVGKPEYLAASPGAQADDPPLGNTSQPSGGAPSSPAADDGVPQHWGILEASRRISAVRSVFAARSKATRDRPVPPRDAEARSARSAGKPAIQAPSLDGLLQEEMQ